MVILDLFVFLSIATLCSGQTFRGARQSSRMIEYPAIPQTPAIRQTIRQSPIVAQRANVAVETPRLHRGALAIPGGFRASEPVQSQPNFRVSRVPLPAPAVRNFISPFALTGGFRGLNTWGLDVMDNFEDRLDRVNDRWDRVSDRIDDRFDTLSDRWDQAADRLDDRWDRFSDRVDDRWDRVSDIYDNRFDRISDHWDRVSDRLDDRWDRTYNRVGKQWDRARDRVENRWDRISDRIDNTWDRFSDRIDDRLDRAEHRMGAFNNY